MRAALFSENDGIEAMMQRERAAAEQPRHQSDSNAGKRAGRNARQDCFILCDAGFSEGGESAGNQLAVAARDGNDAVESDVEGDGGGMRRHHPVSYTHLTLPTIYSV